MSEVDEDKEIEILDEEKDDTEQELIVKTDDENQEQEEKPAKREIPVELGIEELKSQLEEERRKRETSEEEARTAREEAAKARNEVDDTNLLLLNGAIRDLSSEINRNKEELKNALEVGDMDRVIELQESLITNKNNLDKIEQGKKQYEARLRTPQNDPVEAFCSQLSPKSANWIRAHPQCVTDPRLNQKMIAAHNLALADGIAADTNEYFSFIEDILKFRKEEPVQRREERRIEREDYQEDDPMSEAAKPTSGRKPSAPPAAPVSRAAPNGSRPNTIRLSAAEREMASMMNMTDAEYAKNKAALIKEGKLHN